jgi:hypothetical protein
MNALLAKVSLLKEWGKQKKAAWGFKYSLWRVRLGLWKCNYLLAKPTSRVWFRLWPWRISVYWKRRFWSFGPRLLGRPHGKPPFLAFDFGPWGVIGPWVVVTDEQGGENGPQVRT